MARHQDNARERVLDGFEDLLITNGDAPVTLSGVATRIGLTKGGLLYHFPSKAALVSGLVDRFQERTRDDLAAMTAASEGAAANYLRISDYLSTPLHRTTLAMSQLSNSEPAAADALNRARDAELAAITADVGDPVVARLTMLFADGLCFQAITTPDEVPEHAAVIDWFTTHVLAPHTRPTG
jgi:AcrR family transcriptional regulator